MDLLNSLAIQLNFTYSLKDVRNPKYFQVKSNHSFPGTFEMVQRGECDFLWLPISIGEELSKLVDQTVSVLESPIIIFSTVHEIGTSGATWGVLSGNPMVFGLMVIAFASLAFVVYLIERRFYGIVSHDTNLSQLLWDFFGTIFLEPLRYNFHVPSKMIVALWWLSVIVVVSQLGGNMKADLTVKNKITIDTIRDILDRPNLKPIIADGMTYQKIMKMSKDKDISAVYQRSVRMKRLISPLSTISPGIVQEIVDGTSVVIFYDVSVNIFLDLFCDYQRDGIYHISDSHIMTMSMPIMYRKGLDKGLRKRIDRRIRYFAATKLVGRADQIASLQYAPCFWKPKPVKKTSDIVLLVTILFVGFGISGVTLLLEIFFRKILNV